MIRAIEHDLCGHFRTAATRSTVSRLDPHGVRRPRPGAAAAPHRRGGGAVPHRRSPTHSSPPAPPQSPAATRSPTRPSDQARKPRTPPGPRLAQPATAGHHARRDEIGYQLALSMLPAEMGPDDHLAPTGTSSTPNGRTAGSSAPARPSFVTCGTSVPARGVLRQAYSPKVRPSSSTAPGWRGRCRTRSHARPTPTRTWRRHCRG